MDTRTQERIRKLRAIIDPKSGAFPGERANAKSLLEKLLASSGAASYNYTSSSGFSYRADPVWTDWGKKFCWRCRGITIRGKMYHTVDCRS